MRRTVFVSLGPAVMGRVRFGTYRSLSEEWTHARSPCPIYPSYHFGSVTAEAPEAVNAAVATSCWLCGVLCNVLQGRCRKDHEVRMATIVIREIGCQANQRLSSHVSSSHSAVRCPASSLDAPIGADQSPSHMDSDEEAGTAASLDHIIARLQTLEVADQVRNASDSLVVVNVRSGVVHRMVGDPSNPADWQTRCDCCFFRFADSREEGVFGELAEFVCAGSSHARPFHSPHPVLEHMTAVSLVLFAPLQSHSWPETRKRVGGWDDRWSNSCAEVLYDSVRTSFGMLRTTSPIFSMIWGTRIFVHFVQSRRHSSARFAQPPRCSR